MVDYDAIEGVETPTYAGATDVGPNFTIRVNSDSESDLTGKISLIGTEQPTSEVDADGNTILVVGSVRKEWRWHLHRCATHRRMGRGRHL